jgi:hypothetical protein
MTAPVALAFATPSVVSAVIKAFVSRHADDPHSNALITGIGKAGIGKAGMGKAGMGDVFTGDAGTWNAGMWNADAAKESRTWAGGRRM